MKFAYLSDIHIDNYFNENINNYNNNIYTTLFDKLFNIDCDCLIVAGDIANSNDFTIRFLEDVKKLYNFKHIFFVFGNHDFYLYENYKVQYLSDSELRRTEIKEHFKNDSIIHILDGNAIEIDNIKIGGAGGWYDGSYTIKTKSDSYFYKDDIRKLNYLWRANLNDYKYIYEKSTDPKRSKKGYRYNNFLNIFKKEHKKVLSALEHNVDIMITHYPPIANRIIYRDDYKSDINGGFYSFDGEDLILKYNPKIWVYGHMHDDDSDNKSSDVEIYNTRLLRNPLGYKNENRNIKIKFFEID